MRRASRRRCHHRCGAFRSCLKYTAIVEACQGAQREFALARRHQVCWHTRQKDLARTPPVRGRRAVSPIPRVYAREFRVELDFPRGRLGKCIPPMSYRRISPVQFPLSGDRNSRIGYSNLANSPQFPVSAGLSGNIPRSKRELPHQNPRYAYHPLRWESDCIPRIPRSSIARYSPYPQRNMPRYTAHRFC